jgi:hypothetical protein
LKIRRLVSAWPILIQPPPEVHLLINLGDALEIFLDRTQMLMKN